MSKLFTSKKKPLKFFMDPHPKRKNLQKQIESNGGKLVAVKETDSIELAPFDVGTPFSSTVSRQVYSSSYIKDCIESKQLLDLKSYSLLKNSLTKTNRKLYRPEEEEKMKKYVEDHIGSPLSLKFWEEALIKGLDLQHSAESLRYHWKRVMPNKSERGVSLPGKRQSSSLSDPLNKKAKLDKLFIPDHDEMKNIRVLVRNNSRNILDFAEINLKCEEEEIDDKFERLVIICSHAAGKKCSVQEVLRALVARNGNIHATVEHFNDLVKS